MTATPIDDEHVNDLARVIWRVNRDNPDRDREMGTEDALFRVRSIRERYERMARAALTWLAQQEVS